MREHYSLKEDELKAENVSEGKEVAAIIQADHGGSPLCGDTNREEGRTDGERLPMELYWVSLCSCVRNDELGKGFGLSS